MPDNPMDKLLIPPVQPTDAVKLTLTKIKNTHKKLAQESAQQLPQAEKTANQIEKIAQFIDKVRAQATKDARFKESLRDALGELDDVKERVSALKEPQHVEQVGKQLDEMNRNITENVESQSLFISNVDMYAQEHKKSLLKASKVTSSLQSASEDTVEMGKELYKSCVFASRVVGTSFCSFWDKSIVKLFGFFNLRGNILVNLFSKLGKGISTVFSFIKNFVIESVEWMYTKMVQLASIGWKVISTAFTVLSYPIRAVGGFLAKVFSDVMSTPTGILSVGILLGTGFYLFAKPVREFVGKIISSSWEWIKNAFTFYYEKLDQVEVVATLKEYFSEVTTWLSGVWTWLVTDGRLSAFYNKTFGAWTGLSTTKLQDIWTSGVEMLKTAWAFIKDVFISLHESGVFDEMHLMWTAIKSIINSNRGMTESNLAAENSSRIQAGLPYLLNQEVESLIQSGVLEMFYGNFGGQKTEQSRSALISRAKEILDNFKSTRIITPDSDVNKELLNNINVSPQSIVSDLFHLDDDAMRSVMKSAELRTLSYAEKVNNLVYARTHNTSSNAHATSKVLDRTLGQNINKLNEQLLSTIDSALTTLTLPSSMDSDSRQAYLNKLRKSVIEQVRNNQSWANEKWAIERTVEIESRKMEPIPQADGGVVKGPINALIGEAGYPEVVIPLNKDGISFIYNSMKDLIVKEVNEEISMKPQDVIRRVQKNKLQKTDVKIYDMRNISTGVVGFR